MSSFIVLLLLAITRSLSSAPSPTIHQTLTSLPSYSYITYLHSIYEIPFSSIRATPTECNDDDILVGCGVYDPRRTTLVCAAAAVNVTSRNGFNSYSVFILKEKAPLNFPQCTFWNGKQSTEVDTSSTPLTRVVLYNPRLIGSSPDAAAMHVPGIYRTTKTYVFVTFIPLGVMFDSTRGGFVFRILCDAASCPSFVFRDVSVTFMQGDTLVNKSYGTVTIDCCDEKAVPPSTAFRLLIPEMLPHDIRSFSMTRTFPLSQVNTVTTDTTMFAEWISYTNVPSVGLTLSGGKPATSWYLLGCMSSYHVKPVVTIDFTLRSVDSDTFPKTRSFNITVLSLDQDVMITKRVYTWDTNCADDVIPCKMSLTPLEGNSVWNILAGPMVLMVLEPPLDAPTTLTDARFMFQCVSKADVSSNGCPRSVNEPISNSVLMGSCLYQDSSPASCKDSFICVDIVTNAGVLIIPPFPAGTQQIYVSNPYQRKYVRTMNVRSVTYRTPSLPMLDGKGFPYVTPSDITDGSGADIRTSCAVRNCQICGGSSTEDESNLKNVSLGSVTIQRSSYPVGSHCVWRFICGPSQRTLRIDAVLVSLGVNTSILINGRVVATMDSIPKVYGSWPMGIDVPNGAVTVVEFIAGPMAVGGSFALVMQCETATSFPTNTPSPTTTKPSPTNKAPSPGPTAAQQTPAGYPVSTEIPTPPPPQSSSSAPSPPATTCATKREGNNNKNRDENECDSDGNSKEDWSDLWLILGGVFLGLVAIAAAGYSIFTSRKNKSESNKNENENSPKKNTTTGGGGSLQIREAGETWLDHADEIVHDINTSSSSSTTAATRRSSVSSTNVEMTSSLQPPRPPVFTQIVIDESKMQSNSEDGQHNNTRRNLNIGGFGGFKYVSPK
eukprot:PhF_6_TR42632/c0_g1_i1/m.64111